MDTNDTPFNTSEATLHTDVSGNTPTEILDDFNHFPSFKTLEIPLEITKILSKELYLKRHLKHDKDDALANEVAKFESISLRLKSAMKVLVLENEKLKRVSR